MTDRILSTILEIDPDTCLNTYGVAPCTASGSIKCVNTFSSCQDKPNFVLGTKTYSFTEIGAPIPVGITARPYITAISTAPTEIDPEKGLAGRNMVSITMRDDTSTDVEADKYIDTRPAPAGGTFWSRFKARHPNYANRYARIKRAYVDNGVWGPVSTELYVMDTLKGPGRGEVTLTLRDPIVLATKTKVPPPTSGKLAVALGTNDTQMTLGAGDGAQYPASGYVRVGDQIIQYTTNVGNVLSWPDGTYRSKFGTGAVAQKIGDGVQLCKVFIAQPVYLVLKALLNDSGVVDANIDVAGMQIEDENWLGAKYLITACIASPEDADKLIADICKQTGGVMWWSPTAQKARFKVIGPRSPMDQINKTLTDNVNIIDGTVQVDSQDNLRITRSAMYYDMISATANRNESKNYPRGDIHIDEDAESTREYGSVRSEITFSRWFTTANAGAMRAWVQRRVTQYRNAPDRISFKLDPQDVDIAEGDLYDIQTADLVDVLGNIATVRVLILRRQDQGTHLDVVARTTTFNRRYGFIAPAGYPNYSAATEAQRAYAYISDASGKMSDGTDGYLII